ncbi:hypothetical protein VNO77_04949 [Canavalia gladiata]|uniref:Uncharacterized protein n=1 Tax=Canavalia gladiata TaxID=3824 RepID=A0AAN9R572_CANGL
MGNDNVNERRRGCHDNHKVLSARFLTCCCVNLDEQYRNHIAPKVPPGTFDFWRRHIDLVGISGESMIPARDVEFVKLGMVFQKFTLELYQPVQLFYNKALCLLCLREFVLFSVDLELLLRQRDFFVASWIRGFTKNLAFISVYMAELWGALEVLHLACFLFAPMTKKNSKMTPNQLQENTAVQEEKPSSTQKRTGNEIDEIFAGKKRKKSEVKKTGKPDEVTKKTNKTKKKKNVKRKTDGADDGDFVDPPSRPRKKTEDGLSIYTEEELGMTNADAGNTPLCPFDCSCCF